MDVVIDCAAEDFTSLIREIGFDVTKIVDYFSGTMNKKRGRMHILFKQIDEGKVFCDLHWDSPVHFMFMGVDYLIRPKEFYETELQKELQLRGFRSEVIGGFTWSTRKNKALLSGLRLPSMGAQREKR